MTTTPSSLPVGQLIELDGSPPAAHLLNADPGPPPKDLLCGSPRLPDGGRLEGILLPTKDGESIPSSKPAPPPRPPPRRGSTSTSAGHRNTTTNPNHRGNVPMTSNRREDIKRSLDRQGDIKGEEVGSQKVEREQPKGRPRTMESGTNGDIEVTGLVGQKVSGSESEATESADSDDADEGGKVDEEEKEDKEGIVMAAEGLLGLCKSLGPGIDCSEQSENERGGSAEERDFLRVFVTGIFEGSMTEEDAASFAEICKGKHGEGRAWFAHFTTAQAPADGSISSGAFHHLVEACTIVLNGCEQHADYVPAVCLLPLCFTCYRPVPENQGGLDAYLRTGRAWLAGSGGRLKSLFGSFGSSQSSQQEQMEKEAAAAGDVEGGTNLEDENKDFLYNHLQELPVWRTSRFWSAAFFTVTHHSPLTEPSSPSQEDGGMTSSLRLLTKRMVLLGVGRKHCTELIRKHAAMGHLQPEQLDELIRSVDEATSP